jgi:hypothetical protein
MLVSAETITGYKRPVPLEENFFVKEFGGEIHISGVAKKDERERIATHISTLREAVEKDAVKTFGLSYVPDDTDLIQAAWLANCVRTPSLTSLQWLKFAGEGWGVIGRIFTRVLICSREAEEEPVKDKDGKEVSAGIKDGVDAAKEEIQTDPLASGGGSTATVT